MNLIINNDAKIAQPVRTIPTFNLILTVVGLSVLVGCVNYSGINNKQQLMSPEQFRVEQSLPQQQGIWPSTQWAAELADKQLTELISLALTNNPDLHLAKARIDQARATADGRRAHLFPFINAQAIDIRDRIPANKFTPQPLGGSWQTMALAALNFSYELDFWGKNYASFAQAQSLEKVAQARMQTANLMIATHLATTYNQLDYQYALQDILRKTVNQRSRILVITKSRIDNGLETETALYQARNLKAQAETMLVAVAGDLQLTHLQLGALLGKGTDVGLMIKRPHFSSSHQPRLPDNLPIELLGRRADLVAARWQVQAALHGVRQIKASFYPNINLRSSLGYFSFGLSDFFNHQNQVGALVPAVSLPIFDAGALRAALKGKNGQLDQAIAQYNGAVNQALSDVAQQLAAISATDGQLLAQFQALTNAKKAFNLAQQQYRIGLTNQLLLLNAETRYLTEQQHQLVLVRDRRNLQVALIKALGGGFKQPRIAVPKQATLALFNKDTNV